VDGSSQSRRALQRALSEAVARRVPLTVLSVRDDRAVTCTAGGLTQGQAAEEVQDLVDQAVSSQSGPALGSVSSRVADDAACPVVVIFSR
jgi:nucleotide-binding universal stress UspA family protein